MVKAGRALVFQLESDGEYVAITSLRMEKVQQQQVSRLRNMSMHVIESRSASGSCPGVHGTRVHACTPVVHVHACVESARLTFESLHAHHDNAGDCRQIQHAEVHRPPYGLDDQHSVPLPPASRPYACFLSPFHIS